MPLITQDYKPKEVREEIVNNNILKDFAVFMRDHDVKYRTVTPEDEMFIIEKLDYTVNQLIDKYHDK